MKQKAFYVQRASEERISGLELKKDGRGSVFIKWACHGGVSSAWNLALAVADWPQDAAN